MKCNCESCKRHKKMQEVVKYLEDKAMDDIVEYIYDLMNEIDSANLDLSYYKAIVKGEWPNSDKLIEQTREANKDDKKNI